MYRRIGFYTIFFELIRFDVSVWRNQSGCAKAFAADFQALSAMWEYSAVRYLSGMFVMMSVTP